MIKGLRTRTDLDLTVSRAIPAQNTSGATDAIDLVNVPLPESVQLQIAVEALPNLADGQTVIAKIQDSDDGENFADATGLASLTLTGAGGAGAEAATLTQRSPLTLRRYVRANVAASATAGDNTAASFSFALAF